MLSTFFGPDLKTNIKNRLKSFTQLKKQYNFSDIYRCSQRKCFSKKSKIEGCPNSRPNQLGHHEDIRKEDIYEPVWYATDLATSHKYCRIYDCKCYKYAPRDTSVMIGKKLFFLDLTGPKSPLTDEYDTVYKLDQPFMRQIYDHIIEKYKKQIYYYDLEGDFPHWSICLDKPPCEKPVSLKAFECAYGYHDGARYSDPDIDR